MRIWAPPQNNFIFDQVGHVCRYYTYDIGSWDMDNIASKGILHGIGLSYKYITTINISIRNDGGEFIYHFAGYTIQTNPALHYHDVYVASVDNTWILINRIKPGEFATPAFNDPAINRGVITLFLRV